MKRKSPENQWFSGLGGGDKRDRTADLLNAIQALSQLSYTPMFSYAVETASVLYHRMVICQGGILTLLQLPIVYDILNLAKSQYLSILEGRIL